MPIRVSIADEQSALRVDRTRLRQVARKTLQAEGIIEAQLSVALVDDPMMQLLNRRHLQHDYPTDVLSFRLSDQTSTKAETVPLEGELVISTDTAIRQAAEFSWSPQAELLLYLVHGLLHLCGYDDHSAGDRRRMQARERTILQNWGLTPHYRS